MYWNHRVLKRVTSGVEEFIIVEVYYDDDDHHVLGWTENAMYPWGINVDEVRQTLHWMLDAVDKDVLDEEVLEAESEARGPEPIEEYERLTIDELLESLGLEREDVEKWEDDGGST